MAGCAGGHRGVCVCTYRGQACGCVCTCVYVCVCTTTVVTFVFRVDESLCNVEPSVGVEVTPSLERRDTITTVDGEYV